MSGFLPEEIDRKRARNRRYRQLSSRIQIVDDSTGKRIPMGSRDRWTIRRIFVCPLLKNEIKPVKKGRSFMFIERERTRLPVTWRLDPFRNFNFRLVGDSLRRSFSESASERSIKSAYQSYSGQPRLTTLWPWLRKKMTYVRLYRWGNDEKKDDKRKSFPSSCMAT